MNGKPVINDGKMLVMCICPDGEWRVEYVSLADIITEFFDSAIRKAELELVENEDEVSSL